MVSITRFVAGVAVFCAMLASAHGVSAGGPDLKLGTATPGGGFELFGETLAVAIGETTDDVRIETVPTRGSRDNLKRLEAGEIDIGLVEGNAARQALDGLGRAPSTLKVVGVMYPNPGMFVVRAESPYETIEDLKGQPVAFGTRASGLRILVGDVLSGLGLVPDRDFGQIILDKAADGPRLVLAGEAEALWGAGVGWPGFVRVADSTAGARFIAPTETQRQQILAAHPHLRPMTVPAGTYRGQDQAIESVGLWSLILIRPDVDDEVAYRLAAALHGAEKALAERLPQGRYATAANTVREVPPERLHPGAARFYDGLGSAD